MGPLAIGVADERGSTGRWHAYDTVKGSDWLGDQVSGGGRCELRGIEC